MEFAIYICQKSKLPLSKMSNYLILHVILKLFVLNFSVLSAFDQEFRSMRLVNAKVEKKVSTSKAYHMDVLIFWHIVSKY